MAQRAALLAFPEHVTTAHRLCDWHDLAGGCLCIPTPGYIVVTDAASGGVAAPLPRFGRAVEYVVRALRGKVFGQRGFTMPAQGMAVGDRLLTVQEPTRIEPFTEHTGGMAHTSLLRPVLVPRGQGDGDTRSGAAQGLWQERSKRRTTGRPLARGSLWHAPGRRETPDGTREALYEMPTLSFRERRPVPPGLLASRGSRLAGVGRVGREIAFVSWCVVFLWTPGAPRIGDREVDHANRNRPGRE